MPVSLRELKRYLSSPPLLHTLKVGEKLYLYLEASEIEVNGVLVREEQGMQFPVYYVIQTPGDAETRYPYLEKLELALISASKNLMPYFQCHPICVLTTYRLRNILYKLELSGRLAKRPVELGGYDIKYQPQTAIKSQILTDFVVDFTLTLVSELEKNLCYDRVHHQGYGPFYGCCLDCERVHARHCFEATSRKHYHAIYQNF